MSLRSFTLGLCALAAVAAPAQAQSSASASISGLRYELVDLDLTDSIAPAITFTSHFYQAETDTYSSISSSERQETYDAGTLEISRPFGFARASTGPDAVSSAIAVAADAPYSHVFVARTGHISNFTLTPNTGLRVFAVGALDIAQPQDATGKATFDFFGEISGADGDGSGRQVFYHERSSGSTSGSGRFDLTGYLRTDERAATGLLRLSSWTLGHSVATIPEPSTYAMLLAGVLVVGAGVRRRRA